LKLNGITDANLVVAGQTLQLPSEPAGDSQPIQAANGDASNGTAPPVPGAPATYVVQAGDSLFSIAAKIGLGADLQAGWVAKVSGLNGIDAGVISAGQTLRLP